MFLSPVPVSCFYPFVWSSQNFLFLLSFVTLCMMKPSILEHCDSLFMPASAAVRYEALGSLILCDSSWISKPELVVGVVKIEYTVKGLRFRVLKMGSGDMAKINNIAVLYKKFFVNKVLTEEKLF